MVFGEIEPIGDRDRDGIDTETDRRRHIGRFIMRLALVVKEAKSQGLKRRLDPGEPMVRSSPRQEKTHVSAPAVMGR